MVCGDKTAVKKNDEMIVVGRVVGICRQETCGGAGTVVEGRERKGVVM
jgi:hypothetical protein